MSEDLKMKVLSAVSFAMASIFCEPNNSFKWVPEAHGLIQKWVDDHGEFGMDGIVEALSWWQEEASDENPFPLTRKEAING